MKYKKKKLSSGLNVVMSNMPFMESVSIGVWIKTGGRYEGENNCGISHFIEHMLFKGTFKRNASKLKQEIEGVGGQFNGFTSEELTCYLVKIPSKFLALGLDVLSDMVRNPKMDKAELEKEKEVICEEIKMYKDQPSAYVHELLSEIMWPGHPLGLPLAGYEKKVRAMTKAMLSAYMERYYVPSNICVVAAGKLSDSKLIEETKKHLSYSRKKTKKLSFSKFKVKQKKLNTVAYYKDTQQTHFAMGFHSYSRNHKYKYALNLLHIILGGNMSSRLFEELRERRALCYDVSSSVKKYEDTGAFLIHAGVDNNRVEQALHAVIGELNKLKTNAVSQSELNRAKQYYKGQMLLALEDTGTRMLWLGDRTMSSGGIKPIEKIMREIDLVVSEDVKKVANEIFTDKKLNVAVICPKDIISEQKLRKVCSI